MQELLPFGEYIPPDRFPPAQQLYMGLEAWELERILARLAVTNGATTFGPIRRRGQARAEPLTVQAQHAPGLFITIQQPKLFRHMLDKSDIRFPWCFTLVKAGSFAKPRPYLPIVHAVSQSTLCYGRN